MKAMVLAAGRGERMRPLTDHTPKPLLSVGGQRLIEYHLKGLARAGFEEVVINTAHLADQIPEVLGDGSQYGLRLSYTREPEGALETGGGIHNALPLLGEESFLVVNGDVWCDVDFRTLIPDQVLSEGRLAHLLLVNNPDHNPKGDFQLGEDGQVHPDGRHRLTFSGIAVYHPDFFASCQPGRFPLAPMLREAMVRQEVTGQHHSGQWYDIGTPQRLAQLDRLLTGQ